MNAELSTVLEEALRMLFLGVLPLLVLMGLGGLVSTLLQSAFSAYDQSLGLAIRLLFFIAALYLLLPGLIASLLELARMSFA